VHERRKIGKKEFSGFHRHYPYELLSFKLQSPHIQIKMNKESEKERKKLGNWKEHYDNFLLFEF